MRVAFRNVGKAARQLLGETKKPDQIPKFLYGKEDLPSVKKFVEVHTEHLARRKDIKSLFTSDPETVGIAKRVLGNTSKSKSISAAKFFEDKFLSQQMSLSQERGSVKVLLSDIADFPDFAEQYRESVEKNVMMCVGGPAAEDQSVMTGMISSVREKLDDVVYMTRDYAESNANHSAMQSHARHGNALNADRELTGHALLPTIILRGLIGITTEETMDPDYRKVDVQLTIDPKKLRIYFGNELNWLKQEYRRSEGKLTEHDINRLESMLSQEIICAFEEKTGKQISGGAKRAKEESSSVHVAITERDFAEVSHENEELRKIGIDAKELTAEEKRFFFNGNKMRAAWRYPGDTHLKFDAHETNRELAQMSHIKWIEGEEVSRIFLTKNKQGNAEIAGVGTKDGKYFYANKLHFTGGYKVEYEFDPDSYTRFNNFTMVRNLVNRIEDIFGFQKPLTNGITTSTGVSINAIFKRSDRINRLIERYGSTGEIAVTNSHWTMIAHDPEHVVMRMTGGGNTGSEEYNPAYFLNVLANTRRLFGDDLVGILSTYGCPRAVNARNSTEFARIAEGGIISYGKGETGNTKRHAEAAIGLMMLGFEEEVVEYFNQFQSRKGQPLGKELEEIYKHAADVEFMHDNVKRTNRRMGYDKSISIEEMMATALMVVALSYALSKKRGKEKEGKGVVIEEVEEVDSTSPKPTSSTHLAGQSQKEETEKSSR